MSAVGQSGVCLVNGMIVVFKEMSRVLVALEHVGRK